MIKKEKLLLKRKNMKLFFVNRGMSRRKIKDETVHKMESENRYQGSKNKFNKL
jgi:hypothetical protein